MSHDGVILGQKLNFSAVDSNHDSAFECNVMTTTTSIRHLAQTPNKDDGVTCAGSYKERGDSSSIGAGTEESYRAEIHRLRRLLDAAELGQISLCKKEKRTPPAGILQDLCTAILDTDLDLVHRIIKGSWDLNVLGKEGVGPLHLAAKIGSQEICRCLIRSGARIQFLDQTGSTPANIAAIEGTSSEFKEAIIMEFLQAAANNDEEILRLLIEDQWDVNSKDPHGLTALHKAAGQGHKYICQYLIQNGANIDAKDVENETPLQKAKAKSQTGVVQYLMEKGAEVARARLDGRSFKRKEQVKTNSSLHRTMNRLSILMFWDRNRREKAKSGHIKLSEDSNSPGRLNRAFQPLTPDQGANHGPTISTVFCELHKSSFIPPGACSSPTSPGSYDEYQCGDDEHHLWGQFLDPRRRA